MEIPIRRGALTVTLEDLERRFLEIRACVPDSDSDEHLSLIACEEALMAAREMNYGVGALLLDPDRNILVRAHNQAFNPRFRSDLHAEMVVLNEFEEMQPKQRDMRGYTMFVTLEPCPMCTARLLISGVETVRFVAPDDWGGMVSRMDALPPAFKKLQDNRRFVAADVSEAMRSLALDLFVLNLDKLRRKLWER